MALCSVVSSENSKKGVKTLKPSIVQTSDQNYQKPQWLSKTRWHMVLFSTLGRQRQIDF